MPAQSPPLEPPAAPPVAPKSTPPPPPPPPKPKRRFRKFLTTLFLLSSLGYAGGVWYSLQSDDFHDIFTEWVPFGEEAVLFFEEREFHRRFPNAHHHGNLLPQTPKQADNKVTIPSKSGLSWSVSKDEASAQDSSSKGRHMSAVDSSKPKKETAQQAPEVATPKEKTAAVVSAKKETTAAPTPAAPATPEPKPAASPAIASTPSIDPLNIDGAAEPVIQEIVKTVNDLIAVVNADGVANKFNSTLSKAKDDLTKVAAHIVELKKSATASAEDEVKKAHAAFDEAAKDLLRRVDDARAEEAAQFRDEWESEREKLSASYQEKLKVELEAAQKVAEQRLRNELVEQAIELKRTFISQVESLVEKEREGRLSKLQDLTTSVRDLEKLTSDWNGVIDANLKTQQLQVAIDAVRAVIAQSEVPRPFVRELAAVKELAGDNAVVAAAIASINPTAYQRGIASSTQLIDRFRRVAAEVRKAALLPEDAGIASHATSLVLSKVMFKKQGLAEGDDVESVLTRTETLLEEGRLDEAAREMNGLNGWAKMLSKDWMGEVRRVLEVRQAIEVCYVYVQQLHIWSSSIC